MIGINANTGAALGGIDHLRQSVRDILTTPIGTRVMRREYGSRLYELVDAPMNPSGLLDLYAATAEALAKWEPRIDVEQVSSETDKSGRVLLTISGRYTPTGEGVTIDGVEVA